MKNKRLEEFKEKKKEKKIAVLGLGVSNIPAIEYLHKLGAYIYAWFKRFVRKKLWANKRFR